MPGYAWRCRECGKTIPSDPRCWPALDEAHHLIHEFERRAAALFSLAPQHPGGRPP